MATSKQGRIVKIRIDGHKHYGIVKDKMEKGTYIVRFPMHKAGDIAVVDVALPAAEIERTRIPQDSPVAWLLRQLTGVYFPAKVTSPPEPAIMKKPVDDEPNVKLVPVDEPTQEQIDNFLVKGVKIKDMPEGMEKAMAKSVAKSMIQLGSNGIDFI